MYLSPRNLVFRNAGALVFEPEISLRNQIRATISQFQFDNIHMVGSVPQAEEFLEKKNPDVLIIDALKGGVDLVRKVRADKLGNNLTVPIVATTGDATQAGVNKLISHGADSVLIKPYSPQQLLQQITNLTKQRKPFVVTSSYIGPDRRKSPERGGEAPEVMTVEVPNPLALKISGHAKSQVEIDRRIDEVRHKLLTLQIEENGIQLQMQLRLTLKSDNPTSLKRHYDWLLRVARDIHKRVREVEMDDQLVEIEKLIDVIERAADKDEEGTMRVLNSIADRIARLSAILNPDVSSDELEARVDGNIKRYEAWFAARSNRLRDQVSASAAETMSTS